MLETTYAWYIEDGNIALVEANCSRDIASNWQSISTAGKTVRIHAVYKATSFTTTLTDDDKTYNLDSRFRYILSDYVIARGYEDPRNMNLKAAGYFLNKFRSGIRTIKKTKNNRQLEGSTPIRPSYY